MKTILSLLFALVLLAAVASSCHSVKKLTTTQTSSSDSTHEETKDSAHLQTVEIEGQSFISTGKRSDSSDVDKVEVFIELGGPDSSGSQRVTLTPDKNGGVTLTVPAGAKSVKIQTDRSKIRTDSSGTVDSSRFKWKGADSSGLKTTSKGSTHKEASSETSSRQRCGGGNWIIIVLIMLGLSAIAVWLFRRRPKILE